MVGGSSGGRRGVIVGGRGSKFGEMVEGVIESGRGGQNTMVGVGQNFGKSDMGVI